MEFPPIDTAVEVFNKAGQVIGHIHFKRDKAWFDWLNSITDSAGSSDATALLGLAGNKPQRTPDLVSFLGARARPTQHNPAGVLAVTSRRAPGLDIAQAIALIPRREWSRVQLIADTQSNRANYPAALYHPALYFETDAGSTLVYRSDGTAWIYIAGIYQRTQAQLAAFAAGLGTNDTGLLVEVTDYDHVLQWTGSAWTWGPGEIGSGYYQLYEAAPNSIGANAWALCDGSTVARLNADGTTTNITLDDVTTARYLKGGLSSSGVAARSGNTGNAATGITLDDHPSHTHDDASSLATPDLFAEDVTGSGVAARTGGPSATLSHSVNDPQHQHTSGNIELDRLQKRLYFRR